MGVLIISETLGRMIFSVLTLYGAGHAMTVDGVETTAGLTIAGYLLVYWSVLPAISMVVEIVEDSKFERKLPQLERDERIKFRNEVLEVLKDEGYDNKGKKGLGNSKGTKKDGKGRKEVSKRDR